MKKNICFGLGLALAFAMTTNAQTCPEGTTCYKIFKVGSEENQSFDVLVNDGGENKVVTEAKPMQWPYISPIVPDGKMFKSYTIYKKYVTNDSLKPIVIGDDSLQVATPGRNGLRFMMPRYDVYVSVSYESLRYYINANEVEHGSVSFSFSDRMDVKDRTKPGFKVTVKPKADEGYKLSSITVSKYLDPKTTVTCAKSESTPAGPGLAPEANDGSCVFAMPSFDVDITAEFVADSVKVPVVNLKDKKFNVTYELNGGTLPEKAEKAFACTEMAVLPVPTKDGYDFVGWSVENKLDNMYYALDRLDGTLCADTTLYAIWTLKGTCLGQKAVVVDSGVRLPVCSSNLKCALFHDNGTNQDSVCTGIVWASDLSILPSSSSVESSSSEALSSSSEAASSSSETNESSSSESENSSSSVAASSSSVTEESSSSEVPASSSATDESSSSAKVESSSAKDESSSSAKAESSSAKDESSSSAKAESSSAKVESSSSAKAESSSAKVVSSSSAKAESSSAKVVSSSSTKAESSSAKVVSSSSTKAESSSAKVVSSSSAKPASSSAKSTSSSSKKESSSSSKVKSSSSVEVVVESVKTEEDLPNCTEKRENVTYYVSELKKVFVCKAKKWTTFDPNGIPVIANIAKFSVVSNGRMLQIAGAKVGSKVSLLDMQGRVIYSGSANAANFSMNVPRSGSYLLRIGSRQKVVNIR